MKNQRTKSLEAFSRLVDVGLCRLSAVPATLQCGFTDHATKAPLIGDQVGGRCANYRRGDSAEAVVGSATFLFIDVDCEVHVVLQALPWKFMSTNHSVVLLSFVF